MSARLRVLSLGSALAMALIVMIVLHREFRAALSPRAPQSDEQASRA